MRKKPLIRITKVEKFLLTLCFMLGASALLVKVFCGSLQGNMNMSVEKLKYQISEQEKKNESLKMQVNELTSFDKIKNVVKDMGLSYNNENIIVIQK